MTTKRNNGLYTRLVCEKKIEKGQARACSRCTRRLINQIITTGISSVSHSCNHIVFYEVLAPGMGTYQVKTTPCLKCRTFPCGKKTDSKEEYLGLTEEHSFACADCKAKKQEDIVKFWMTAREIRDNQRDAPVAEHGGLTFPCCKPMCEEGSYLDKVKEHLSGCSDCRGDEEKNKESFWMEVGQIYQNYMSK